MPWAWNFWAAPWPTCPTSSWLGKPAPARPTIASSTRCFSTLKLKSRAAPHAYCHRPPHLPDLLPGAVSVVLRHGRPGDCLVAVAGLAHQLDPATGPSYRSGHRPGHPHLLCAPHLGPGSHRSDPVRGPILLQLCLPPGHDQPVYRLAGAAGPEPGGAGGGQSPPPAAGLEILPLDLPAGTGLHGFGADRDF